MRSRVAGKGWRGCSVVIVLMAALAAGAVRAGEGGVASGAQPPFAVVGGEAIPMEVYQAALHEGARRRFFHGAPSPEQLAAWRREVGEELIDRVLLRQEAKRRGLAADEAAVAARLAQIEEKFRERAQWQSERAQALPRLRARLEEDELLERLEAEVRRVPEPGAEEVRKYYQAHPDKFTAPERMKVSLILLKVEPSAPAAAWKAAEEEAARLVERLRQGADFADLARLHSGDASAGKGGDLGYIHRGMLAKEAQQALDGLKPGEIAAPLVLLRGVAILRLDERVAPVLGGFDASRQRARDLLARERGGGAWQALVERLRKETPVVVNEKNAAP
ncbi:MAG: peptidylprolyl isomerase [Gammaproteobacteria bacterium]|nr:peptidylprolyl isomerase [Gammaproteobacteria bacterium]